MANFLQLLKFQEKGWPGPDAKSIHLVLAPSDSLPPLGQLAGAYPFEDFEHIIEQTLDK